MLESREYRLVRILPNGTEVDVAVCDEFTGEVDFFCEDFEGVQELTELYLWLKDMVVATASFPEKEIIQ